jgi:hypothetical protein
VDGPPQGGGWRTSRAGRGSIRYRIAPSQRTEENESQPDQAVARHNSAATPTAHSRGTGFL